MKVLIVILAGIVSFLMLKYRRSLKEFVGNIGFAEKYLGMGGTNTFIVLLAILIFVVALMYALGTFQSLIQATLGRFF
mgnify:CR=1 FL=1